MLEPGCPVATTCGGCPLMGRSPAQERAVHESRLWKALELHLGRLPARLPIDWVTLPQPKGYRRRIRLRILDDARVGFFNPNKSEECRALTEPLRQLVHRLLDTSTKCAGALLPLHHLELREPDSEGMASAYFVKRELARPLEPNALERLGEWLDGLHWAVAAETARVPHQKLHLPAVWHLVPIGSFLQVNQAISSRLVADLVASAQERGLSTFCDLYAGSGNFTLPLLASGLVGHAVEVDPEAGHAAELAAKAQNLPNAGFTVGDAGSFAEFSVSSGQTFDLVIVDPPRAGIRQALPSMAAITRKHFVYCSCNLDTLARDLGHLCQARFELESVTLYDMFPGTSHVECVVWLHAPSKATR